jgi:hypothetical protein
LRLSYAKQAREAIASLKTVRNREARAIRQVNPSGFSVREYRRAHWSAFADYASNAGRDHSAFDSRAFTKTFGVSHCGRRSRTTRIGFICSWPPVLLGGRPRSDGGPAAIRSGSSSVARYFGVRPPSRCGVPPHHPSARRRYEFDAKSRPEGWKTGVKFAISPATPTPPPAMRPIHKLNPEHFDVESSFGTRACTLRAPATDGRRHGRGARYQTRNARIPDNEARPPSPVAFGVSEALRYFGVRGLGRGAASRPADSDKHLIRRIFCLGSATNPGLAHLLLMKASPLKASPSRLSGRANRCACFREQGAHPREEYKR